MPTTFGVISLGVLPLMDPIEGNNTSENAASLIGMTFGGPGNALANDIVSLSPGTAGFSGGSVSSYDQDNNNSNDTFSIDGGSDQFYDGQTLYNITVTFLDHYVDTGYLEIFQDINGNSYATLFGLDGPTHTGPIESITIDSVQRDTWFGTNGQPAFPTIFVTCFTQGTQIRTPQGEVSVESLTAGDVVTTLDHGAQTIRWIGSRMVPAVDKFRPITFEPGSIAEDLPSRPLSVSRQHRMLVRSEIAERMFGEKEVLIAAHRCLDMPGVEQEENLGFVTYWHILCDNHEIAFANGAPSETLHLGSQGRNMLSPEAWAEITTLFPDIATEAEAATARPVPKNPQQNSLTTRLAKNVLPLVEPV